MGLLRTVIRCNTHTFLTSAPFNSAILRETNGELLPEAFTFVRFWQARKAQKLWINHVAGKRNSWITSEKRRRHEKWSARCIPKGKTNKRIQQQYYEGMGLVRKGSSYDLNCKANSLTYPNTIRFTYTCSPQSSLSHRSSHPRYHVEWWTCWFSRS